MPAEKKHALDLASFRYTPVKLAQSAKGDNGPSVRDVEPSATGALSPTTRKSNPIPKTKTDYSERK